MKIIKKPKFPIQKCDVCRCEFTINKRDLKSDGYTLTNTIVICPICKSKVFVEYEKELGDKE